MVVFSVSSTVPALAGSGFVTSVSLILTFCLSLSCRRSTLADVSNGMLGAYLYTQKVDFLFCEPLCSLAVFLL